MNADARRTLVGFGFGASLALIGLVAWSLVSAPDGPAATVQPGQSLVTTPSSTAISGAEPWVAPGEVVFETTVLVPGELTVEAGEASFRYAVRSLAPFSGLETDGEEEQAPIAFPEHWRLTTTNGEEIVSTVDEPTDAVRFDVAATLTIDDVASVDVTGWRLAVPVGAVRDMAITAGSEADFGAGNIVLIDAVIEQTTSTIVQVDIAHPDDPWDAVFVAPIDPGWRVAGRQEGGLQFIWEGSDVPSALTLQQESPAWVAVSAEQPVWGSGS